MAILCDSCTNKNICKYYDVARNFDPMITTDIPIFEYVAHCSEYNIDFNKVCQGIITTPLKKESLLDNIKRKLDIRSPSKDF